MSPIAKASLMAAAALAAISVAAFTSATPGTAKAADQPPRECFNTTMLNGFNAPNDHTLYIRVGVNDVYRMDLGAGCNDIAFKQDIGLRSVPPGDSFICNPLQMEVVYGFTGGIPERCQVNAMHKLTPAEYAALAKHDRP
jgi:hypothetical protein